MSDQNEMLDTPIAIIGMAGRFPGARNLQEYWQNLAQGVESVSFFSDQEMLESGVDPEIVHDPRYVKAQAILDDVDLFDAPFFSFSAREAEAMDPQQRIFLECCWQALEDANCDPDRFEGAIGVYAGASPYSYLRLVRQSNPQLIRSLNPFQAMIVANRDFLATLVSYKLNLKGPALTIQTACSTSLAAIAQACQNLLAYQCDLALSGGVTVSFPLKAGQLYQEGEINSPDGHCRAFDEMAQGTVGGNGAGVVVLKRFGEALEDGDAIHAVIRGSALNNDGAAKVGFTAPSVEGQAEVIRLAQSLAGVHPESITMIEAHGTGTLLGDPIEVAALTQAFREETAKKQFCALGSVKSNIGHADSAAGAAGLIKAVLALEHRQIPPTLHCSKPNPRLDLENSPFYVNSQLRPWPSGETPRRAGVSSFGIGGTNAHAVLEEAPSQRPSGSSRPWQLLLLSAQDEKALNESAANLEKHLRSHPEIPLADAACTLQRGRKAFNRRRALICPNLGDAAQALREAAKAGRAFSRRLGRSKPAPAFLFPGQGSQYPGMARELYEQEAGFREELDRCAEALVGHMGVDLRGLLFGKEVVSCQLPVVSTEKDPESGSGLPPDPVSPSNSLPEPLPVPVPGSPSAASRLPSPVSLSDTWIAQPALFAVEYSLARLWMKWGVEPQALLGHSVGEYAAACLAGVFALEEGLGLVAARGRLIQGLEGGSMLAVALPEADVAPLLGGSLALAAVNGPGLCTASGPRAEVAALRERLREQGVEARLLHTSHAFHSPMMDPVLEDFGQRVAQVRLQPPSIPVLSNLSGGWMTASQAVDPGYWVQQLRATVRFSQGLEVLMQEPGRVLLEVGPGRTLTNLAARHSAVGQQQAPVIPSLPHPQDGQPDQACLLEALGKLWLYGVELDWPAFYDGEDRQLVHLPTYPFQRRRYWAIRDGSAPARAPDLQPASQADAPVPESAHPRPDLLTPYLAPRNEYEESIVLIWQELLGVEPVGVRDDFHQLGGHSLMATQVMSRLREAYPVELPVEIFFESSTVEELAHRLEERLMAALEELSEEEAHRLLEARG